MLLDLIPGYREAELTTKAKRIESDLMAKAKARIRSLNPDSEMTQEEVTAMLIKIQQEGKA